VTFHVEHWADVGEEIKPLLMRHWAEMPFDLQLPVCPDWSLYGPMAEAGTLHLLTARADGALGGYFIGFIQRHPHYSVLVGAMDIYYLLPEHRKAANGLAMFMEYERTMRERGVKYLLATSRLDRNGESDALFKRLGWKAARTVYEKRLET